MSAEQIDFASLMQPVAARLAGEPNQRLSKPPCDVRFGKHGSLSINYEAGQFYDHEANVGGGVCDLVKHKIGCDHAGALAWLRQQGFLPSPEPRLKVIRDTGASYDYVDEDGVLLSQVIRHEPKDFRQRRPDGREGWIWNLEGVRRVLYHLPDLIAASGNLIFITEGEKDCDNVRALGFTATTNMGGAGKWLPEYNEFLRGADVVLLPHNDSAGRDHADKVATALNRIARRVRVLDIAKTWSECPQKGDISDWIEAGGTADSLKTLIGDLPDWEPPSDESPWPVMDVSAYHGLAGDIVKTIAPHTEADPIAVLIQVLTYFGNVIGRSAYYQVEADRHHTNLFVVLVGNSSKGRKGVSGGRALSVITDPRWKGERLKSGLSSGEGFINEVRDEIKRWDAKSKQFETVDPGISDKRLMITENEFANALIVMQRAGNNLSPHIRMAWDGLTLATMTKNTPIKATGAHISIAGHVTEDELRANLTRTDAASGFANRFLFVCVRRSKELPFGGNLPEAAIAQLAASIEAAIEFASKVGRVTMTDEAKEEWVKVYSALSAPQPGLLGAVTARGEAQVVRLALVYALIDQQSLIGVVHLKAALAVWEYCESSAAHIFGDSLGDPVADEIYLALRQAGANGMTRTAVRDLFGRNRSGDRIGAALGMLHTRGRARAEVRTTGGRPSEVWFATGDA